MEDLSPRTQLPDRSLAFFCVALGIFDGLLVGVPILMQYPGIVGLLGAAGTTIAGGLVGYRRRDSRAFLYFALVCGLVLIAVLGSSMNTGV